MGGGEPAAPEAPSDSVVVERARAGDHQAFRVLVERYQARLFRLALRVLRDEEQARDAVQDALLKIYRSLDRFEGRSSFYTWAYRLVMNQCLDARRRDHSERHVAFEEGRPGGHEDGAGAPELAAPLAAPDAELERGELRGRIQRAIDALPEDARRTFLLREVDGLSYAEIARSLRIPKGTVMSRLHYARRRLRATLLQTGAEPAAGSAPGAEEIEGVRA
jgi:RNA polymerase sigma-70 factor (ECF subfamily)